MTSKDEQNTVRKNPEVVSSDDSAPFVFVNNLSLSTAMGTVYKDVSFSVPQNSVCCVYGEPGTGKTALLLSVCGRMKMGSGAATVGGYNLKNQFRMIRQISNISFIEGINDVQPFLEVKNIMAAELALAGIRGNKANTNAYLEKWDFLDRLNIRFNELNVYDTKYFGILLAMANSPKLLIVDDVQADLTQHQSKKLVSFLKSVAAECDMTVLFNSSEYEIARDADGIVVVGEEAEAQRRAVLRDEGMVNADTTAIFGQGNGVSCGHDSEPGSFARRASL